jgi:hypothetical protein
MKQGTYVYPYCGANILTRELAKTHVKHFIGIRYKNSY